MRKSKSTNSFSLEKQLEQKIKKSKHWDHDIEYIDGDFVEVVVMRYQQTQDEELLAKITNNYAIYKGLWARAFSLYLDNDLDAGEAMHNEIIWFASNKFDRSRTIKRDGKAFNAYYVSACLNQLKNLRNARMSHKNHPRIKCPICGEEVFQIDTAHLKHHYDLDRYKKDFDGHPIVSNDGKTSCPITGEPLNEITEQYLNRIEWKDKSRGYYTVQDFHIEFSDIIPKGPFVCPITNLGLNTLNCYPSGIAKGYTVSKFIEDFPDFKGIFKCPFTGKKILEMTQEYLDIALDQIPTARKTIADLLLVCPNATIKALPVQVLNPYSNELVSEITLADLLKANTTLQEHLSKYMSTSITLDKWYPNNFFCPFTGKGIRMMKRDTLKKLKKSAYDFFLATTSSPLKKWQVKCAICGEWVDNVWTHLLASGHSHAKHMNLEEFSMAFQGYPTKANISTNSFYESSDGDSVHVSDLLVRKIRGSEPLEVEDSLLSVAEDDIDKRIASCVKNCKTIDDVFHMSSEKRTIKLRGKNVNLREAITEILGDDDFDLSEHNGSEVNIMIPARDSIKKRLLRLYQSSDLAEENS